jgi:hypothetical protein
MNRICKLLVLIGVSMSTMPAFSATVRLVPEAAVVTAGSVEVELILEASDVADGCVPRCSDYSGEVEISFDADDIRLVSVTPVTPAMIVDSLISGGPFEVPEDGVGPVVFGLNGALEQGTVAVLEFLVTAEPGATVAIDVVDSRAIIGSFGYSLPTNQFFEPDFIGTELQVVPVPAAAWLFLSALAAVAARARRAS